MKRLILGFMLLTGIGYGQRLAIDTPVKIVGGGTVLEGETIGTPPAPETNRPPRKVPYRQSIVTNTPIQKLTKRLEHAIMNARNDALDVEAVTVQKGRYLITTITTAMPDESKTNDVATAFGKTIGRALERKQMRPFMPIAQEVENNIVTVRYQNGRTETRPLKRATTIQPEKALGRKLIEAEVHRIMQEGSTDQALQELQKITPITKPEKPIIGGKK